MPTLSVVIPTKNEERYLPAVLESIRRQSLQPDEVIVADAWSTDATRSIVAQFGGRVVDGGLPSTGRNRGAAASSCDLIFFFDGDVIICDDAFLEKAVKEFVARDLDIATADVGVVDGIWFDHLSHGFYNWYARLMGSFHPHAPGFCILVKRSLHEAIHGFSEDIQFCEDHEYAARACRVGKFGFLDSIKIYVTTRRQNRDGRLSMSLKYILADLHLLFLGPIRGDKFKYGFEYEVKK
jgi:glycosyltransferase involved in cell wall biosynthesis